MPTNFQLKQLKGTYSLQVTRLLREHGGTYSEPKLLRNCTCCFRDLKIQRYGNLLVVNSRRSIFGKPPLLYYYTAKSPAVFETYAVLSLLSTSFECQL